MDRLTAFKSFKDHAWLGRVYAKLSSTQIAEVEAFITANAALPVNDFEMAAHRLYLDKPKPKNHTAVTELLVCANSIYAATCPVCGDHKCQTTHRFQA